MPGDFSVQVLVGQLEISDPNASMKVIIEI
jgi:hypothetical protein